MPDGANAPAARPGPLRFRGFVLDPLQLDAVREAANVGACNAAMALSGLTGQRVNVEPPAVAVRPLAELLAGLADPGARAAAVVDTVLGDLAGQVVFVMPQAAPGAAPGGGFTRLDDMEPGMFRHAADLVIGAYIDHIGGMLGLVLSTVPGIPAVHDGGEVAAGLACALDSGARFAFCVDSRFTLAQTGQLLQGHFLFLPEQQSLPLIIGALFGARGEIIRTIERINEQ